MRTLRYIVLALLFLLFVTVVIGFFLPAKVHLERSIIINREAAPIFNVVNTLKNFNKWSPWYGLDINAKYTLSGADKGVGSKLEWVGNKAVGSGSNEITESVLNSHIKTKMFFGKSDAPAFSTLSLSRNGKTTKVTWAFDNDFGMNVFYRYFGLVIEKMIAPDYEKGLQKLKTHVESLPVNGYSNISIVNTRSELVYTIAAHANLQADDVAQIIGSSYGKIIRFLGKNGLSMNGSPKIINISFDEKSLDFLAAIPVVDNSFVDKDGEIKSLTTYAGKAIKLVHKGTYKNFNKSYDLLFKYIADKKLELNGNTWEDYVTDPGTVAEKDLITHLYQPIK